MKLFLDSADAAQWALAPGSPPVQGVTTNPTLILQAGLQVRLASYQRLIDQAAAAQMPELMLQLPAADVVQALEWTSALSKQAKAAGVVLTLKLPCHPAWEPVARALAERGQPFLLTGVANPIQLLWAQRLNASYVAPYLGRLQADGRDVWSLVQACVAVQAKGPRLLAASIKSADALAQLVAQGAYAATLRPDFLRSLTVDSLTVSAMAQFDADVLASLQDSPGQ